MFHFDPSDYLCPLYLQKNVNQTYGFQFAPQKSTNNNPSMKVSATSA